MIIIKTEIQSLIPFEYNGKLYKCPRCHVLFTQEQFNMAKGYCVDCANGAQLIQERFK